jgi:hypothetical protein
MPWPWRRRSTPWLLGSKNGFFMWRESCKRERVPTERTDVLQDWLLRAAPRRRERVTVERIRTKLGFRFFSFLGGAWAVATYPHRASRLYIFFGYRTFGFQFFLHSRPRAGQ